jgi:hypothetical protein
VRGRDGECLAAGDIVGGGITENMARCVALHTA